MRVLVIGNPIAGPRRGKGRGKIDLLRRELEGRGHSVEVFLTGARGDAARKAGEVAGDVERVVVVGGDGTINEVVNGINPGVAGRVAIAQLPMGTANILAHEFGLPKSPGEVARLVGEGKIRRMDVGVIRWDKAQVRVGALAEEPPVAPDSGTEAHEKRFLMLASVGFDAMVTYDIFKVRRGGLGYWGYARPILRTIFGYRAPVVRVRVDGGEVIEGGMVVVSFVKNYGGIMSITDRAGSEAGKFAVCVLRKGSIPALLGYSVSAFTKRMSRRRDVVSLMGREVSVEADSAVPVQVDGDYVGKTGVVMRVEEGGVGFVVPG